ncbi:MAG: hypothetical protein QM608_08715 [Caulobacter sp.]
MTPDTHASSTQDVLEALHDISAKLDRLIDLISVAGPTVERPAINTISRRRRLAS